MERFYIITNLMKDPDYGITKEIQKYIEQHGRECILAKEDEQGFIFPGTVPENVDCGIVLGGDGTLIRAARELAEYEFPLIGINLGTLGFLAEVERSDFSYALERLFKNQVGFEERMMLSGEVSGNSSYQNVAVNDERNQRLADNHEKSFYDKGANGGYYCREWTQEDVDTLYGQWQEQLALMKEGYRFTKQIPFDDECGISGVFGPEADEPPVSASGATIITLPNGSRVDLGHFDTTDEAKHAVEVYLSQQVEAGTLTQSEADNILIHGAVDKY